METPVPVVKNTLPDQIQYVFVDKDYTQDGYDVKLFKSKNLGEHYVKMCINGEKNGKYICYFADCETTMDKTSELIKHLKTNKHMHYCPCGECDKIYSNNSNLASHYAKDHLGVEFKKLAIIDPVITIKPTVPIGITSIIVDNNYNADGWQVKKGTFNGKQYHFKCKINPEASVTLRPFICHFDNCKKQLPGKPSDILCHYSSGEHNVLLYCETCDLSYSTTKSYDIHIIAHGDDNIQPLVVDNNSEIKTTTKNCKMPESILGIVVPEDHVVPEGCKLVYIKSFDVYVCCELNPQQDNKNKLMCHFKDCNATIQDFYSRVLTHYHGVEHAKTFSCTTCNMFYKKVEHLNTHNIDVHPDIDIEIDIENTITNENLSTELLAQIPEILHEILDIAEVNGLIYSIKNATVKTLDGIDVKCKIRCMKNTINTENPYMCEYECNHNDKRKTYKHPYQLLEHLLSNVHNTVVVNKPTYKTIALADVNDFIIKIADNSFTCGICSNPYENRNSIRKHIQRKHVKE
jgi:hypothetical protein